MKTEQLLVKKWEKILNYCNIDDSSKLEESMRLNQYETLFNDHPNEYIKKAWLGAAITNDTVYNIASLMEMSDAMGEHSKQMGKLSEILDNDKFDLSNKSFVYTGTDFKTMTNGI